MVAIRGPDGYAPLTAIWATTLLGDRELLTRCCRIYRDYVWKVTIYLEKVLVVVLVGQRVQNSMVFICMGHEIPHPHHL